MRSAFFALPLLASPVLAEVPQVVTDIPPVHSLVASVMQGVGTPTLLLPPGGSAHGHQMRPSEAAAMSAADLVVWVGEELSPWIADASAKLAPDAASLSLIDVQGTVLREAGHHGHDHEAGHETGAEDGGHSDEHHDAHEHDHDGHDHADGGEGHAKTADAHDDHGHEHKGDHGHQETRDSHAGHDHDDHGHDSRGQKAAAQDGHFAGDGHDHDGLDPHVWLNPDNAQNWLATIAQALATADPENAATYQANAKAEAKRIAAATKELEALLQDITGGYIVYHDAFGYFSDRFDLPSAGSVADSEATPPGARGLADLQASAQASDVRCLFIEPQFDGKVAERTAETLGLQVGVLDPLGADLTPGPDLYTALVRNIGQSLHDCLSR
ncbi:zinc transport system substrate-binding protein [Pseudooceanicola nitratireducens]|mgnify:CR=1 FL=1|jgi:zinc transport system substrate-binding protein|uniref:High-affinity zinc uptake system protein ZnuA n=1 Tax=Pseudooceanicola nitratireducens TaxID=517719 RepID=A0A1I1NSZ8_9RHOB|nr:zinc ABC transporter substrate-binding protein [Pseudooceanicola nitratireducens]SEI65528.1 zinc transport system substrate-binding protein [Pseudooceanicola nitratireducens]SFD00749.1 zinc transport system substrate-binding protein [Pseudooceanicola nitratireducens]